jgi:hypothetical protein
MANLAESSKEGYGSKTDVLMIMTMMLATGLMTGVQ